MTAFDNEKGVTDSAELTLEEKQLILGQLRKGTWDSRPEIYALYTRVEYPPGLRLQRISGVLFKEDLAETQDRSSKNGGRFIVACLTGKKTQGGPYTKETLSGQPELSTDCPRSPTGRCEFGYFGSSYAQCSFCERQVTNQEADIYNGIRKPRVYRETPQGAPNQIQTPEQALLWKKIIGEQNYQATLRALKDSASLWLFTSEEEAKKCTDLTAEERETILNIFENDSEGLGYAGFIRVGEEEKKRTEAENRNRQATLDLLNGIRSDTVSSGNDYQGAH